METVHRTASAPLLMCLQVTFPQLFTKFYGATDLHYKLPQSWQSVESLAYIGEPCCVHCAACLVAKRCGAGVGHTTNPVPLSRSNPEVLIRELESIADLTRAIQLEKEVWALHDADV